MRASVLLALALFLPAVSRAEPARKVDALPGDLAAPDNFEQYVDRSHLRRGGPDDPVAAAPSRPRAAALAAPAPSPLSRLTPDQSSVPAWTPTQDVGRSPAPAPYGNAAALLGLSGLGILALRSFGRAVADAPQDDSVSVAPPRFIPDPVPQPEEPPVAVDLEPLPDDPPNDA